jgi:hypothetical protein
MLAVATHVLQNPLVGCSPAMRHQRRALGVRRLSLASLTLKSVEGWCVPLLAARLQE